MKRIYVIAGLAVLLVGLLFLSSTTVLGQVATSIGMQSTITVSNPPDRLIVVPAGNYSYFSAMVPNDGSVASTFTMIPSGLNIFVMDQSNFTMFEKNESAFTIKSMLNQSSPISLSLTNHAAANETYYFVIQNNIASKQASDVLVHYEVTSKTIWPEAQYLPYVIVVIGLSLMAFGMLPIRRTKMISAQPLRQVTPDSYKPAISQAATLTTDCKFCGATMSQNETFCPSCKKSQI